MRNTILRLILIGLLMFGGVAMASGQTTNELAGTQWQLVSMAGTSLPDTVTITLQFVDETQAGGTGGCNSYSANYMIDARNIQFTDIVSTLMACDNIDQEQAYFAALESAVSYERVENQLIITYADDQQLIYKLLPMLPGTSWRLIWLNGDAVLGDVPLTLNLGKDGQAAGNGGCNNFSSQYTTEGSALTFEAILSTRRACIDDALNAQEQAYFAALETATSFSIGLDHLTIIASDGTMLRFEHQASLTATSWQLNTMSGEAPAGAITLQFDDENRISGSGGCNQYSGSYTLQGEAITFGEVVSTERACLESDVMDQEIAFYVALSSTVSYELIDDQLIITYGEDDQQLVFTPATTINS